MRDGEELHALAQLRGELIAAEPTVVVDIHDGDLGADLHGELLPRHEVGVVLEHRGDDAIAALQVVAAPRVRHEVHTLGRVAHEDDLALARCVDQPGDLGARLLEYRRRALAELVDAAMDVRVVLLEHLRHGVDHLPRLLTGCRIVEVDERFPAHCLGEDRKVLPDPRNIERRGLHSGALEGDGHQARPA